MISLSTAIAFILICLFLFFGIVVFFGAPYVPSHRKDVRRAFRYFGVNSSDVLVDIGSGDGLVLRIASAFGAKAVGYEINPILVGISRLLSLRDERVSVSLQNLWLARLPRGTTIVYVFSVHRDEKRLISFMQREANRLDKPLKLLCYANPFSAIKPVDVYQAYSLYVFQPLQSKNA